MSQSSRAAVLVDEAHDVTATEFHWRVMSRLASALAYALRGRALVLSDIFLRVDNVEQAAPDVVIIPGLTAGKRNVYAVPDEPVPAVTIEVLSPLNHGRRGRILLEKKRELFARIGVPLHIEIDPDEGFITVWECDGGVFVRTDVCTTYTSEALGDVRIGTPSPGVLHVWLPNGHEVLDDGGELTRAEESAARAAESDARAARMAAKLRALGVDPDDD